MDTNIESSLPLLILLFRRHLIIATKKHLIFFFYFQLFNNSYPKVTFHIHFYLTILLSLSHYV